jgi:hypothetical protein
MIRVTIVDTTTGEQRSFHDDYDWWSFEYPDYIWADGNYSCDCNRGLMFSRDGGEDDPHVRDRKCGGDRYKLRIHDADDGRLLYEDGDWPADNVNTGEHP